MVALTRSLERRIDAEASESVPLENRVLVRRSVFSLRGALVSEQEIASGITAWYLLYDSPFDSSHPCTEVYVNSVFSFLISGTVNARAVHSGRDYMAMITAFQHYLKRSEALHSQNMHNGVRQREFKRFQGNDGFTNSAKATHCTCTLI